MQVGARELKLTAFEHFMWADDRPDAPMTFYLRLRIDGVLEEQDFRAAVSRSLATHTLLTSVASGNPSATGRKLTWQSLGPNAAPHIDWIKGDDAFSEAPGGFSIDIRKEIGVRFFVRVAVGMTTILAQFHHAAVDARGGCRFLEDVLAHYHALRTGMDATTWLRPLTDDRLASRNSFGLSRLQFRQRRSIDLRRIAMYFTNQPEILSCKRPKSGRPLLYGQVSSLGIAIEDADFAKLRNFAKTHHATINDVLLRDLFITLNNWNARYLPKRGSRVIRLAMPIDMRRQGDENMPAANVVSMCFLDRRPADMVDEIGLLHSVREETQEIKVNDLGVALIRAIAWVAKFRGGFKLLLKPNRFFPCHTTAVLSNLGQPLIESKLPRPAGHIEIDGARIESLELMPPYRPNTPLAVGIATVGSALQVTLHYNRDAMNQSQVGELRSMFERRLKTTLNWKPEPVVDLVTIDSPIAAGGRLWSLPIGKNVRAKAPESPSFL